MGLHAQMLLALALTLAVLAPVQATDPGAPYTCYIPFTLATCVLMHQRSLVDPNASAHARPHLRQRSAARPAASLPPLATLPDPSPPGWHPTPPARPLYSSSTSGWRCRHFRVHGVASQWLPGSPRHHQAHRLGRAPQHGRRAHQPRRLGALRGRAGGRQGRRKVAAASCGPAAWRLPRADRCR
jgi:hypothetical protein